MFAQARLRMIEWASPQQAIVTENYRKFQKNYKELPKDQWTQFFKNLQYFFMLRVKTPPSLPYLHHKFPSLLSFPKSVFSLDPNRQDVLASLRKQTNTVTGSAFRNLLSQQSSIPQHNFSGQVWSFYALYNIMERIMIQRTKLLFRCRKHRQTTTHSTGSLFYALLTQMEHFQLRKKDPQTSTKVEEFFTEKGQQGQTLNEDMRINAPNQEFLSFAFDFDEDNGEMGFALSGKREERETADRLENH